MNSPRVLLVGWDAADWKVARPLLDAGKMPNLQRLVERGASGQVATLHPPLSPMLWTSIATGKRPFQHGILGFAEPAPDGCGVQPVTNLSRKSKALWNILHQNDLRSLVIGWWPSHPAEPIRGVMVSDQYHRAAGPLKQGWPVPPNAVHPPELAETLAHLRVHPEHLTPQMVEPFVPLAREINQDRDQRLSLVLRTLAECLTIQSSALWLLENQPWDFCAIYYDSIDHFCHGFMKYHPPRQSWIGERDFELYHNVVSMAYQHHDQMLGSLLEKAGPDTTVILMSDHGFHPDHLRPSSIPDIPAGPAIEHRDYGILALNGPGIRKDELLHGASVLDIAPTILGLFGLAVGEDMDGKVLSQAFVQDPQVAFVGSWEEAPGADGRHPPHTRLDPFAAQTALEQMIALGYVERPDENREIAVTRTLRELRYNLGEAYQDAARHMEAHAIFSELSAADPDEQRFAVRLFVSCQALALHEEMRRIVEDMDGRRRELFEQAKTKIEESRDAAVEPGPERSELVRWRNLARFQPALVEYLKAQVAMAERRYEEALDGLEEVAKTHPVRPSLLLQIGDLYLRLHRWREAHQIYERVLALDPDSAQAHIGLCRIALRRRRFSVAAHCALDALQRTYDDPLAHFLLGRALAGIEEYERSAQAFRAAISFNPNFPEAHRQLATLLDKYLDDAGSAREHRRLARRMRTRNTTVPVLQPLAQATESAAAESLSSGVPITAGSAEMPPVRDSLIVVTGLPRSGTSMLMQMLAAGGLDIISDGLRQADEDNPRGYLEYQPVKNLLKDSRWLFEQRGKAVKIVVPLLPALPRGLACRVILSRRDLEEVLDSEERMLARSNPPLLQTPQRRQMLKDEYARMLVRAQALLARRADTELLVIEYSDALRNPLAAAGVAKQIPGRRIERAGDGRCDRPRAPPQPRHTLEVDPYASDVSRRNVDEAGRTGSSRRLWNCRSGRLARDNCASACRPRAWAQPT